LNLDGNVGITDKGGAALAHALVHNDTLSTLTLSGTSVCTSAVELLQVFKLSDTLCEVSSVRLPDAQRPSVTFSSLSHDYIYYTYCSFAA
jgi:hypothetical protein